MEQVLVLVAKLAGELPHHLPGSGGRASSTRGVVMTLVRPQQARGDDNE
jgi:hypothetical protein